MEVGYCLQALENILGLGLKGRTKPWVISQAVLIGKELIDTPFCVINANDYYGKEAFKNIHSYLAEEHKDSEFCMLCLIIKNTLSENGGVTRGVCKIDDTSYLIDVVETPDIVKTETVLTVDGVAIDTEGFVSINIWGLSTMFIKVNRGWRV